MKTFTGLLAKRHILDPIHGPIPITHLENEVISTPVFQRLRNITQLSLTSLIFPGATHNRFQHSIGTLFVMDKLLYNLKVAEKLPYSLEKLQKIIQIMRLCALLHDCGHLPFSHTFENRIGEKKHEFFGKCIIERSNIREILSNNGYDPETIGAMVNEEINLKDPYSRELLELSPLLHSDADADRMDYLLRDAYFTGVPYGKFDINRICNFVNLESNKICFFEKAQEALEDFLFSRFQMYKIVYIHKTAIGYELLLHKLYKYIEKYSSDNEITFFLPKTKDFKEGTQEWFNETLYNLSEAEFFRTIRFLINSDMIQDKDKDEISKLYTCITNRIPIKNCYRKDDLVEISKTEYCEKEASFFAELEKNYSSIINHWSFLRHDPSNPLRITSPIDKDFDDLQDPSQIRILKKKSSGIYEIKLLQNLTNSVIKSLARHHRVLICYYHGDKESQETIAKLANTLIGTSSV
ncbi:MAG: HD domain-containing protein [Promethearchaeota archaeon]